MVFDPSKYRLKKLDRYETYIKSLKTKNIDPKSIENSVTEAITNIQNKKARSFVVYGEPQSGKTSMMIGLTAKLLDNGFKLIILLIQDNLDLLTALLLQIFIMAKGFSRCTLYILLGTDTLMLCSSFSLYIQDCPAFTSPSWNHA